MERTRRFASCAATLKGGEYAVAHPDDVAAYAKEKYGLSDQAARSQWELNERAFKFDDVFYKDTRRGGH
jgi:hypothetical protein